MSTVLAGFLVVLFTPLQRWLQPKLGNRRMPTAMILTTIALLAVVLPVAFVLYLLLSQICRRAHRSEGPPSAATD